MKWLGIIAAMALAAIILSIVTDVEMAKCQSGSAYAMMRFCKPDSQRRLPHLNARFVAVVNELKTGGLHSCQEWRCATIYPKVGQRTADRCSISDLAGFHPLLLGTRSYSICA